MLLRVRQSLMRVSASVTVCYGLALLAPTAATALPLTVTHFDLATCDVLSVPTTVDELGTSKFFPADESILSALISLKGTACPSTNDLKLADSVVEIVNLTSRTFGRVWYVADKDTSITNIDGAVNGRPAFRIDSVGINSPLFSESIAFNGLFEPGEAWHFTIQDYANALGLPPAAFGSPGVPSDFETLSSGSIIATEVPEAGTLLLLLLGAFALGVGEICMPL